MNYLPFFQFNQYPDLTQCCYSYHMAYPDICDILLAVPPTTIVMLATSQQLKADLWTISDAEFSNCSCEMWTDISVLIQNEIVLEDPFSQETD